MDALKHCRMEAGGILVTKLQHAKTYPIQLIKTKRFCSFINRILANYV